MPPPGRERGPGRGNPDLLENTPDGVVADDILASACPMACGGGGRDRCSWKCPLPLHPLLVSVGRALWRKRETP